MQLVEKNPVSATAFHEVWGCGAGAETDEAWPFSRGSLCACEPNEDEFYLGPSQIYQSKEHGPPMKKPLDVKSIQSPGPGLQHVHMWPLCSSWDLGAANISYYHGNVLQRLVYCCVNN